MLLIHSHRQLARVTMMIVTTAIMVLAGGSFYPALAQDQNPPPSDPNPPPPSEPRQGGLDVDVDINSGRSAPVWYAQWWMWAVGLGVFLIVVIALTRGRRAA
jgi:hypothetical protein